MRQPASSVMLVATKRPCVWKIGSAWSKASAAVKRQIAVSALALDLRFSWVSIAPLERPVVPEV